MAMQALRDGASGGILKFILFGILALAAGGLVFTDVGGFFRGGVSGSNVAKVAGNDVPLVSFDRMLRRNLRQLGLTPQQAYQFGFTREILNNEIRRRLLIQSAMDAGIMVDKEHVVEQIQTIIAPAIQNGMTAEEALLNILRNQGMSEQELIHTIASERALTFLSGALQSGAKSPSPYVVRDLYAHENETRNISYITFPHKDFEDVEEPDEAKLLELYTATKETFASPETRDLTLITLNTDAIADTLAISEENLRSNYENNISLYTTPASRTIEQAIFQSENEAQQAYDAIENDANFKEATKGGDYFPPKSFERESILEELQEPVFSAESEDALPPVKTPLGWNVVNITTIDDENVKSFDSVKASIREEMVQNMLIDEIYTLVDEADEFFITGGSLEDAQSVFNFETKSFEDINAYGQTPEKETPLQDALGDDAQDTLQDAFTLETGETTAFFEDNSGKFTAVHVDSITHKTYTPFGDVKDDLKQRFIADQKAAKNKAQVTELRESGKSLEEIAKENGKSVQSKTSISRKDGAPAPFAQNTVSTLFGATINETILIDTKNGIALARIDKASLPERTDDAELERITQETQKDLQQEVFTLYLKEKQNQYGASVNESLLKRTYGQESETF